MTNTTSFIHTRTPLFDLRVLVGLVAAFLAQAVMAAAQQSPAGVDALYAQGQRDMSPSWRGIGKSHDVAVFMHNDRRRESDGRIAVWMHRELAFPEYFEKEKPYLSTRERLLADCKARRLGIMDAAYYGERFAKGAIVGSAKFKSPDMTEPVPDSIEDQVLRQICAPKARQAPSQRQKTMPQ